MEEKMLTKIKHQLSAPQVSINYSFKLKHKNMNNKSE